MPNTTTISARPSTSETNPLFPLPTEIRHIIYAYAYTPTTRPSYASLASIPTDPPRWLPSICALNRTTYIDTGLWYIATTTFGIPLPSASEALAHFSRFLDTFPDSEAWDAVRRVEIEHFDLDLQTNDRRQPDALWAFLAKCRKVREVTLQFRIMNLLGPNVYCYDVVLADRETLEELDRGRYLRPLRDVVASCGVDRLFEVELPGLQTVFLEVWPTTMVEWTGEGVRGDMVTMTAVPLVEELAGYLREGFRARGREVKVVIRVQERRSFTSGFTL
jgi:hypothetical protein